MKAIFLILLVFSFKCLNAQPKIKDLMGTWINKQLDTMIQQQNFDKKSETFWPRCIYIDSSNKIIIEYRFEQQSKSTFIKNILIKNNQIYFTALDRHFCFRNDSTLLVLNNNHKTNFRKINTKVIIGDGVQATIRERVWNNIVKWQLTTIKNGIPVDTIMVSISGTSINSTNNDILVQRYEFTDLKRYNVNNEKLLGIVFYRINDKNMATSDKIYGIKKAGKSVYLYEKNSLAYVLTPID